MGALIILFIVVVGGGIYYMEKTYKVIQINGKPLPIYLLYIPLIILDFWMVVSIFIYLSVYICFLIVVKIVLTILLLFLKINKQIKTIFILLNIVIVLIMLFGIPGELNFLLYYGAVTLIILNTANNIPSIKRYYNQLNS